MQRTTFPSSPAMDFTAVERDVDRGLALQTEAVHELATSAWRRVSRFMTGGLRTDRR